MPTKLLRFALGPTLFPSDRTAFATRSIAWNVKDTLSFHLQLFIKWFLRLPARFFWESFVGPV